MRLDAPRAFDPDAVAGEVVGIALQTGQHDSGIHSHKRNQLLYAYSGCIRIDCQDTLCILPPNRAAWIPAGTKHRATMTRVVEYRSVYFTEQPELSDPQELVILEVNPLLRELIERMAQWPWQQSRARSQHTLALFFEELADARQQSLSLRLPKDKRLQQWLTRLERQQLTLPPLNQAEQQIGASAKTISRLFTKETGLSYQSWRQQWRLLRAIELLSMKMPISEVAFRLDFSSDSAFIHFFKQQLGCTPKQFSSVQP
ncbi:AraC family transcriptional regulator [Shewanella sp. GXUN23E]|uniref:AraC family transcriptional regulator n=1 Tax=Shewanella sp. GXUN23E TaxID=3422498 RepID=UPI003D7D23C1